jgi:hypothetical protein
VRPKGRSNEEIIHALHQTFYRWKKQFTGLGLPEVRELRSLRHENTTLTRPDAGPAHPAGDCPNIALKPRAMLHACGMGADDSSSEPMPGGEAHPRAQGYQPTHDRQDSLRQRLRERASGAGAVWLSTVDGAVEARGVAERQRRWAQCGSAIRKSGIELEIAGASVTFPV